MNRTAPSDSALRSLGEEHLPQKTPKGVSRAPSAHRRRHDIASPCLHPERHGGSRERRNEWHLHNDVMGSKPTEQMAAKIGEIPHLNNSAPLVDPSVYGYGVKRPLDERNRRDVLLTRTMTSADDCWTDHRLIHSMMAIKIIPQRGLQGRKPRRKMNTQALQDPIKRDCFQTTLKDHLHSECPDNIKEHWIKLKTSIIAACEQTIGYQTKKHQDWFDETTVRFEGIIDKKRKAFQIWQRDRNCATKKKNLCRLPVGCGGHFGHRFSL
ncbi:Hypothetical predicted protein [Podarcis lilfordi]|uniref:Uncharacterized protein n=1 Tax=Podarcis lilfordi TaxID=74358 RepID=A0AA35LNK5_9SAUR|nr:Hypothetical predicted protein [Podarcis lilfordi]